MFKQHFLLYTITPLFILSLAACYYRFVVQEDYLVTYESDCDPYIEHCFIGCEDDECTEEYYYSLITRQATEVKSLCGEDITDCEEAYFCPTNSGAVCILEYCETDSDECEDISIGDLIDTEAIMKSE